MTALAIERPSPNRDSRPVGGPIDILLLHYTGMRSAAAALDRLTDSEAKVSSHYLIDEDGTVYALVPEAARAWHAGVAFWAGARDINARSIGIELVNPGHEFGYRPFPPAQLGALATLARDILRRHPIPAQRVLGHSDVAPARKQDPGELFDWPYLARAGIGLWPFAGKPEAEAGASRSQLDESALAAYQEDLARLGYGIEATGALDETTRLVTTAFQRHFRPRRVDGVADAETRARVAILLARIGEGEAAT
jgi:N-acetylmuramoyl-L-alanine amidase